MKDLATVLRSLQGVVSSSAVVILASPNTLVHSEKLRLVVIATLVCSYSLDSRWNSKAPPAWLNGKYPSSSSYVELNMMK